MKQSIRLSVHWRSLLVSAAISTVAFVALEIYLLPRVISALAQHKLTDTPVVTHEGRAPLNHISHVQRLATSNDRVIVRPNNDTFYSSAWLDLNKEPVILEVPAMGERYYSLQIMDAWTNAFAYVGTRATGQKPGVFGIVGPAWSGTLPAGVTRILSPTATVWVIGRTMVHGPEDVAEVIKLQEGIKLGPMSGYRP